MATQQNNHTGNTAARKKLVNESEKRKNQLTKILNAVSGYLGGASRNMQKHKKQLNKY